VTKRRDASRLRPFISPLLNSPLKVEDVQLIENGSRHGPLRNKKFVNHLSKCIGNDLVLLAAERKHWEDVQGKGKKLFASEVGGSYQVFNARPLSEDISSYCTHGATFLPELRRKYWVMLNAEWKSKVAEETNARVDCINITHDLAR
jgi:exonuclease 3'-5' domain-containing protein 1